MITKAQAKALRKLIEKMSADLTDEDAYNAPQLFPAWKLTTYTTGDRVQYADKLYKCIQAHTAQSDWTPDVAVSLWVEVSDPSVEYPDWKQPTGASDAYQTGNKVSYLTDAQGNKRHWISIVDNNVWSPDVYGWSEV